MVSGMIDRAPLLSRLAAAGSLVFAFVLGWLALSFGSQLALAQAADSLLDVTGAVLLAWAVRVARQPRDAGHPMGHSRAEALGALGIAALAGLLAFEVGQRAVLSLLGHEVPRVSGLLLAAFLGKVGFKAAIWAAARGDVGPAVRALAVDARNDVLVGTVAVIGFIGMELGLPELDAWLTLPLAVYIGWSGFSLGRENIDLLMGAAPPLARQNELQQIVLSVPGVGRCQDLRVQHLGPQLYVFASIEVDARLRVREASGIARQVARLLESQQDVLQASVMLAVAEPPSETASEPSSAPSDAEATPGVFRPGSESA
jgi:cation diffusion facilitator family transporter